MVRVRRSFRFRSRVPGFRAQLEGVLLKSLECGWSAALRAAAGAEWRKVWDFRTLSCVAAPLRVTDLRSARFGQHALDTGTLFSLSSPREERAGEGELFFFAAGANMRPKIKNQQNKS